jgi:hypothetical protein
MQLPILIRILGALGGMLGGGFSGAILLVLIIMVTDSNLGLDNIWPGALIGAIIGGFIGFFSPKIGKILASILSSNLLTSMTKARFSAKQSDTTHFKARRNRNG